MSSFDAVHESASPSSENETSPRSPSTPSSPFRPAAARHPAIREMIDLNQGRGPTDRILVEGRWAHEFLLSSGAEVECVAWCPERGEESNDPEAIADCARRVAERADAAYRVSPKTTARIAPRNRQSGLTSVVRAPAAGPDDLPIGPGAVVLIADGVEYAGNLGALVRIVDACGAAGLVLTNRRARLTHPIVFNASRGAVLTTPVIDMGSVERARAWAAERGITCYLADPDGARDYHDVGYGSGPVAVVVGSEGGGLSSAWRDAGYERLTIPMRGAVDSLNVAVAAGVLLFDACARATTSRLI